MDGVTLKYEDIKPLPKGSVKKMVKDGHVAHKRVARGERTMGSVGAWGHLGFIFWDLIIVPHKFGVAMTALVLSNVAWFWFK